MQFIPTSPRPPRGTIRTRGAIGIECTAEEGRAQRSDFVFVFDLVFDLVLVLVQLETKTKTKTKSKTKTKWKLRQVQVEVRPPR
jgi:hypothetical protein